GDGAVDLVTSSDLVLSKPSTAVLGQSDYVVIGGEGPWTVAAIADLNANGRPDVIAASDQRPGLNFFNGTLSTDMPFFALPTSRPVQRLVTGDFDGDLVEDVAFTQTLASDPAESVVMIAFGVPFGPPLPPVAVARLSNVEQLEVYREANLSHLLLSSVEG